MNILNRKHLRLINQGVDAWNTWKHEHADARPDLSGADLSGAKLSGADFSWSNLSRAKLSDAELYRADLSHAKLSGADLSGAGLNDADLSVAELRGANLSKTMLSFAQLTHTDLRGANLSAAYLRGANLSWAKLGNANLSEADLRQADLSVAELRGANLSKTMLNSAKLISTDLSGADLSGADLTLADLGAANLSEADLRQANLSGATLIETNLEYANLSGCRIYGVSAWNIKVNRKTKQSDLIITQRHEATVRVDDIQVAQFMYLLINYENLRNVLNSLTKRGVLILGRFGGGGLEVLRALGEALRQSGYLPIRFDFERPEDRNYTETVRTLAGLARFVVVDLSGPSVPQELYSTVPHLNIPFVPILEKGRRPYAMFVDLLEHDWVLKPIVKFNSISELIQNLQDKIISPAEKRIETRQKTLNELLGKQLGKENAVKTMPTRRSTGKRQLKR